MAETLFETEVSEWPVRKAAVLSADEVYRYELTRTWADPGAFLQRHLSFVMLNPSIADATKDDPTVQRCMGFARRLGFDGIRVVNLYAFRATDPDDLKANGFPVGPENDDWLRRTLLRSYNLADPVVCAWGNHGQPSRVAWLIEQAVQLRVRLNALGVTNGGAPKHPLARGRSRIPDDAQLQPWPSAASRPADADAGEVGSDG